MNQFQTDLQEQSYYVNTIVNHLITSHSHINKPHKHHFYATILFTRGSGIHEIDFNSYEVKPGSVFMLSPGQIHYWELSEDIEGYIFFHTVDFYETNYVKESLKEFPIFSSLQNTRCIYLETDQIQIFNMLFKSIYEEYTSDGWKKSLLILTQITQIYIHLNRLFLTEDVSEFGKLNQYTFQFQLFEKFVEENFKTEKTPAYYADRMNITPKHLNRITQSIIQKTTTEVIIDRLVLEAKRMLMYSSLNFNEIARILGYEDYAYFSKIFKKKSGESPTLFVKKYGL
jgi:AraC family transcriptional activator of pobA